MNKIDHKPSIDTGRCPLNRSPSITTIVRRVVDVINRRRLVGAFDASVGGRIGVCGVQQLHLLMLLLLLLEGSSCSCGSGGGCFCCRLFLLLLVLDLFALLQDEFADVCVVAQVQNRFVVVRAQVDVRAVFQQQFDRFLLFLVRFRHRLVRF